MGSLFKWTPTHCYYQIRDPLILQFARTLTRSLWLGLGLHCQGPGAGSRSKGRALAVNGLTARHKWKGRAKRQTQAS